MRKKFNRYIVNCINKRTVEIVNDVAANNREFKELTQKIIPILNSFKDALPSEYRKLIEELEGIRDKRKLLTYKALYRQGLKDGIKLCNMLHMFK